jgi:hypothetical protein
MADQASHSAKAHPPVQTDEPLLVKPKQRCIRGSLAGSFDRAAYDKAVAAAKQALVEENQRGAPSVAEDAPPAGGSS